MRVSSSAVKFSYATNSSRLREAPFVSRLPCLGWYRPLAGAGRRSSGEIRDNLFPEQAERREHLTVLAHDVAEEKMIAAQRPVLLDLGDGFLRPADDEGVEFFPGEATVSRPQDGVGVPFCRRRVRRDVDVAADGQL